MENISLTDRIIGKSNQIVGKIDRFLIDKDYKGSTKLDKFAIFIGLSSILTGAAAVASTVIIPNTLLTSLSLATAIQGGVTLSLSLSAIGKVYKSFRSGVEHNSRDKVMSIKEDAVAMTNAGEILIVDSIDILKKLETGEFFSKYKAIKIDGNFIEPKPNEPIELYVKKISPETKNNVYSEESLATAIRKEMFLEEKNPSIRKILSDRIKSVREGSISNTLSTTKKYN